MRDNWLGNRTFASHDAILDHGCDAWNRLIDRPWHIMSIGLRAWPMGSDQWELVIVPLARLPHPIRHLFRGATIRCVRHSAILFAGFA